MKKRSENGHDKESIAQLADKAGRPMFSKAAGKLMPASEPKRINPNSDQGRLIAAKYGLTK